MEGFNHLDAAAQRRGALEHQHHREPALGLGAPDAGDAVGQEGKRMVAQRMPQPTDLAEGGERVVVMQRNGRQRAGRTAFVPERRMIGAAQDGRAGIDDDGVPMQRGGIVRQGLDPLG